MGRLALFSPGTEFFVEEKADHSHLLQSQPSPHPLLAGWQAAKANFLPGLVVQLLIVAVVVSYYALAPMREQLEGLARLKQETGYLYAFAAGAFAGGVLPELMKVLFFQRGRVNRANGVNLLFGMMLWGGGAVIVDAFYRLQGVVFGTGTDWQTILSKMLVDQFLYTPLIATPYSIAGFKWFNGELPGVRRFFSPSYYWREMVPSLLANWAVWIPLVTLVYAMPPALQVPLYSLILTFWVLLFSWINRKKAVQG